MSGLLKMQIVVMGNVRKKSLDVILDLRAHASSFTENKVV